MSMERVKKRIEVIQMNADLSQEELQQLGLDLEMQFLIDTVKQQDEQIKKLEQANARGNGHVKACEEKIAELEKALEFYASKNSYETDVINQWEPVTPVLKDEGEIAKQALNK